MEQVYECLKEEVAVGTWASLPMERT